MRRSRAPSRLLSFAGGAAALYFLEPERGARRRALLRDGLGARGRRLLALVRKAGTDLSNRAAGVRARLRAGLEDEAVSDDTLGQRVRARLGRAVSHAHALETEVREGNVVLRGPILEGEAERLLRAVRRVRGVRGVEDRLERHATREGVPALQGGTGVRARPALFQESWSPALRVGAGVAGGALAARGLGALLRGRPAGGLLALGSGGALLLRASTNRPLRRALGRAGRGAVDIGKTLELESPVEEVFALWNRFENFPRFMQNVLDVRSEEGGRSHWRVRGPAGQDVEWDAEITELVPNRVIAWRSLPGSTVQHAGSVRFEPCAPGRTRIHVRLSYAPPGGALGHAAASLLGADPERALDQDLVRLASLLEEGKTTAHGERVTREDVGAPPRTRS